MQVPRPCSRLDHTFDFRTTVQHATSRQRSPSEEDHYERPAPQPHTIAKLAAEERKSAADSLGGRNFITEKELEELRAEQAGPAGEAIVPEKPLAEVLAEAKQAKEDAFQAQWKQMKTGVPRALHSSFKLRLRCCWYDSRTCAVLDRGPLLHGAAGEVLILVTSLAVTLCMNGGETPVDTCSTCKTSKLIDTRNTRHRSAAYVSRGSTSWSRMASTHGCLSTRTFRCSPASGSCLICGVARTVRSRLEIQFLHTSQLLLQRSILSSVQRVVRLAACRTAPQRSGAATAMREGRGAQQRLERRHEAKQGVHTSAAAISFAASAPKRCAAIRQSCARKYQRVYRSEQADRLFDPLMDFPIKCVISISHERLYNSPWQFPLRCAQSTSVKKACREVMYSIAGASVALNVHI